MPDQDRLERPTRPVPLRVSRTASGARAVDPAHLREMELLVSGAVIFALFHGQRALDVWYRGLDANLTGTPEMAVYMGYYYGKLIFYSMIATFGLHLVTRAFWIGIAGLHAVFPQGVRWDGTEYGPVTRSVYRRRQPSLAHVRDRADRLGSIIFASGFALIAIFLISVVLAAAIGAISMGIAHLAFGGRHAERIAAVLLAMFIVPATLVTLIDRMFGRRLMRHRRVRRVMRRTADFLYSFQLGPTYAPIVTVLRSNFRRAHYYVVASVLFVGLILLFVVRDVLLPRDVLSLSSATYVPEDAGALELVPAHYENLRQGADNERFEPSIQSDLVADAHLRLFIPYIPARHNDAVATYCPDVEPLAPNGLRFSGPSDGPPPPAAVSAVLDCLPRFQPVLLDGRLVADPGYRVMDHPRTGMTGFAAYLPVADLDPGEHTLIVADVPRTGERASRRPREPHVIPFWK